MKPAMGARMAALFGTGILALAPASAQTGSNTFASRPALTLSGGVAVGSGDNSSATAEAGEPAHLGSPAARSLWWRWTATTTGLVQIDAIGTTFNTRLVVYTGALLSSLQRVAANLGDAEAPSAESVVRFQATSGTSYSICLDGYTDAGTGETEIGPVTLTIRQPGPDDPPPNDLFGSASVLPGQARVSVEGTVIGASVEAGEPDPDAQTVGHGPARTVWYNWTAPTSGFVTMRIEADEILTWKPVAAVYTGATLATLALADKAVALSFGPTETDAALLSATFAATAGQTYRLQVGGQAFVTTTGPFVLSLEPANRPGQDDFADAADAGTALAFGATGSLLEATLQAGEPNHLSAIGGSGGLSSGSIWWKWSAPAAGPVTADTRGSDGDTVLVVYRAGTPPTLAGLTLVGGNDDIYFSENALGSAVSFTAAAGVSYYFAATGYFQSSRVAFHLATGPRREPYEAWLLGYPELTGPSASRNADPDADGLTNLQELLHGTHPLTPSYRNDGERQLLPAFAVESPNLVLKCGHALANIIGLSDGAGNGGVPLFVDAQSSSNLSAWELVPATSVDLGPTLGSASIPIGAPPGRWVRLKVSDPNF
jgi:hypothetical protein